MFEALVCLAYFIFGLCLLLPMIVYSVYCILWLLWKKHDEKYKYKF